MLRWERKKEKEERKKILKCVFSICFMWEEKWYQYKLIPFVIWATPVSRQRERVCVWVHKYTHTHTLSRVIQGEGVCCEALCLMSWYDDLFSQQAREFCHLLSSIYFSKPDWKYNAIRFSSPFNRTPSPSFSCFYFMSNLKSRRTKFSTRIHTTHTQTQAHVFAGSINFCNTAWKRCNLCFVVLRFVVKWERNDLDLLIWSARLTHQHTNTQIQSLIAKLSYIFSIDWRRNLSPLIVLMAAV